MEVETGEVRSGATEEAGGAAFGIGGVDEDVDAFDLGEVSDDLGVDPGDGLEFAGPVVGVVGPGDPGGGVGCPFGGHAVGGRFVIGAGHCSVLLAGRYPSLPSKVCKVFHPKDFVLYFGARQRKGARFELHSGELRPCLFA